MLSVRKIPTRLRKRLFDPVVIFAVTLLCGLILRHLLNYVDPNVPFYKMILFTHQVFFLMAFISVTAVGLVLHQWRQEIKYW